MAAPRGAQYVGPATSGLPGRIFIGTPGTTQAYNRFLEANARALGFSGYSNQRQARRSNEYRAIIMQEKAAYGKLPSVKRRTDLLRAFGERQRIATIQEPGKRTRRIFQLDVDFKDQSRGGSYDMYLRRIGRRVGNEEWAPGETPH